MPIIVKNIPAANIPTPVSGKSTLFTDIDNNLYIKNSSGAVNEVGGSGGGSVTSVNATGNDGIAITGGPITTTGVLDFSLGDITPDSVAATGTVTGSNLSGTNTGDQTITLTGDVTGTGTGSFATTLSATGVSPGTYTSVSVDASGRITAGTNPTTLAGYGITDAVAKSGDTMTGALVLSGDPVTDLEAATKQYVDSVTQSQLPAFSAF